MVERVERLGVEAQLSVLAKAEVAAQTRIDLPVPRSAQVRIGGGGRAEAAIDDQVRCRVSEITLPFTATWPRMAWLRAPGLPTTSGREPGKSQTVRRLRDRERRTALNAHNLVQVKSSEHTRLPTAAGERFALAERQCIKHTGGDHVGAIRAVQAAGTAQIIGVLLVDEIGEQLGIRVGEQEREIGAEPFLQRRLKRVVNGILGIERGRDGIELRIRNGGVAEADRRVAQRSREFLRMLSPLAALIATGAWFSSEPAYTASSLDGRSMGWLWALPFVGMLLSIAIGPLLSPKVWHADYGKIALGWRDTAPLAIFYSTSAALTVFVHTTLAEYMSFIFLLFALYTVAGGILLTGSIRASPWKNAGILALWHFSREFGGHYRCGDDIY